MLRSLMICRPHSIFFRVIKSRRMRWAGQVARIGSMGVYMVLVGRPQEKRPFGRPRSGRENNNKMDVQ
jgi:hypothetical protein